MMMTTAKDTVNVPLIALSVETQVMLSNLLNPTRIIPTETNLPRDWRGVAELATVPSEMMSVFEAKPDPFKEVYNFLLTKDSTKLEIDDLKAFLAVIDRYDVLDDVDHLFDRDRIAYITRISEIPLDRSVETVDTKQDSRVVTFEDALRAKNGLGLGRYDAFILYADDDSEFASEIVHRMESEYNLKLCSKDRDLLPGLRFEHEVIGRMIEDRCNRLLVILSPSFLESSANQFLVSYAQAVALDTRCRKIIPCVYKKCELPVSVRYSFCIDYNRSGKLWNFWEKLSQSLITSKNATTLSPYKSKLTDCTPIDMPPCPISEHPEWWDANKLSNDPDKSSLNGTKNSELVDIDSASQSINDRDDTISIHSQAQLLPNNGPKSSNWFKKMMSPKKPKSKEKGKMKEKAIAE